MATVQVIIANLTGVGEAPAQKQDIAVTSPMHIDRQFSESRSNDAPRHQRVEVVNADMQQNLAGTRALEEDLGIAAGIVGHLAVDTVQFLFETAESPCQLWLRANDELGSIDEGESGGRKRV